MNLNKQLKSSLLICALVLSTNAMAQDVKFTCIGGTDFGANEGCAKAMDDNLSTKWGMYSGGDKFLIIKASEPIYVTGLNFTHANDNKQYNRYIKEWELLATNDATTATTVQTSTAGWTLINNVRGSVAMKASDDYANYFFATNPVATAYKYFMFKRVMSGGSGSQISEFSLSYTTDNAMPVTVYSHSGGFSESEYGDKMLDGNPNTKWCSPLKGGGSDYVIFGVGSAVSIYGYSIHAANEYGPAGERRPKKWALYGSNASTDPLFDDASWTLVDRMDVAQFFTDDNGDGTGGFANVESYRHLAKPSAPYKYYKYVFLAPVNGNTIQIGEFVPYFNRNDKVNVMEVRDKVNHVFHGNANVTDMKYTRDMNTQWGTACMPYALQSNSEVQLYKLSSISGEYMVFSEVASVEAYEPVVFKKVGANGLTYRGPAAIHATSSQAVANPIDSWTMVGASASSTLDATAAAKDIYYINGDKFWQSTGTLDVVAMRSYFTKVKSVSQAKPTLEITTDETTGLEPETVLSKDMIAIGEGGVTIIAASDKTVTVHAVNGQLVDKRFVKADQATTIALPKGTYVINNTKIVVK